MNNEQLQQLARIYNTLMTINTKGEDTVVMADCLRAMQEVLVTIQKELGGNVEQPEEDRQEA